MLLLHPFSIDFRIKIALFGLKRLQKAFILGSRQCDALTSEALKIFQSRLLQRESLILAPHQPQNQTQKTTTIHPPLS